MILGERDGAFAKLGFETGKFNAQDATGAILPPSGLTYRRPRLSLREAFSTGPGIGASALCSIEKTLA